MEREGKREREQVGGRKNEKDRVRERREGYITETMTSTRADG